MSQLPLVILVLLGIGTCITALLAFAFYRDPVAGMAQAGHRPEKLPLVMIDRYIGLAVLQVGLVLFGTLEMVAVFCVAGGIMAVGDTLIYRHAGHPAGRHAAVAVFSGVALLITLYFIFSSAAPFGAGI